MPTAMTLTLFDGLVIAAYFVINLSIGLYYSRRARASTSDFFLSGRNAPWWLAGTSMVATTFAADTPLLVTGLVAKNGIAGNWLWWTMVMSGIMTVFFYARLWRRAEVLTDVEFAELRYSGKPAAFLRGFRALYLGVPINCIILGWVNLAMMKILEATLNVNSLTAAWILVGIFAFTAFYTTIAGLWGVLVTDLVQFTLMMTMIILLAVLAVRAVGGMDALKAQIAALDNLEAGSRLDFFPPLDSAWMPVITLCVYLSVNWWATWYPGAEPGGGGYVAQRIFSAKDERHGVLATLWFNIAHYALRPWPWIVTALVSVVLYPDLVDKESGYILTFMNPEIFPTWLRGFIIAGFVAAYMSTIATQLNWGASYVVNDFYRRFIAPNSSERQYVVVSQVTTILLMFVSLVATYFMDSIEGAWKLLMTTGAGTGTVLLLRWYWWRINAWSEVSAMVAAAVTSLVLQLAWPRWDGDDAQQFAFLMLATVGITTVVWLVVTLLTAPEPREQLVSFYRRVRPAGPGWTTVAADAGPVASPTESLTVQFVNWVLGCVLVYTSLFGIGNLVFKEWVAGSVYLTAAVTTGAIISRNLSRASWQRASLSD